MRLTAMRGLPGSGKSIKAQELAAQSGAVIVSRDTLRKQTFGRYTNLSREEEDAITELETANVRNALSKGRDVVVDAMHLNPNYLRKWARVASQYGADFDHYDVLTDAADCVVNDSDIERVRAGKHVGHSVILKLDKRWPQSGWPAIAAPDSFVPVPYASPKDKPFAIIVDIDGTLSHIPEVDGRPARSHYDYTKVSTDVVDLPIKHIVQAFQTYSACDVIVMSGREDTCRSDTATWLLDNDIPFDELYMRKAKDYRNDTIVKYELFDNYVRNNYRVLFALDDRNRVVALWRSLGIKCLQVEDGNF